MTDPTDTQIRNAWKRSSTPEFDKRWRFMTNDLYNGEATDPEALIDEFSEIVFLAFKAGYLSRETSK